MNQIFYLFIITEIIFSQTKLINTNLVSKIKSNDISAVWLSKFPVLHTDGNNRLIFQYGYSIANPYNSNWFMISPNIDFGLKVLKNISITSKLNGVSFGEEFFHIIGGGIQYFYGRNDTLNWVSCIQRVNLNAGKDFRLTTITMDFRKLINWKSIQFRIGIGSNFYKKTLYDNTVFRLINKKSQINFIGLDAIVFYRNFNFGIDMYITPNGIINSLFIQKQFL